MLIKRLRSSLVDWILPESDKVKIERAPLLLNSAGYDPWGLSPEAAKAAVATMRWLYSSYFRVETHGIENVPEGRVLIVANHGGQLPFDGLLISLSLFLEANPPRIARGMVERWVPGIPFISSLFTRIGQIVGDPRNCRELLEAGQCVLVFPEGVRGCGKPIFKRYQLQRFGTGFMRLALESRAPIVPVAVIGSEEIYPGIANFKPLARLLKSPYFPITPFFPLLGPVGALPLPAKVTLRYAKPIHFDADPDCSDREIERMVDQVKRSLQAELYEGLRIRGRHIFTRAAK